MASGSFQSSTSYSCYAYITWSSTAGTGGSTVSANLYFKALYRYNFTFRNGYTLGINNNNVSGNGVKVTSAGDWHLLSHSVWVGYTGNCSVGISGFANCTSVTNSSTGNKLPVYNVGGVANLDKVGSVPSTPTISSPSVSTISETTKSITVSWSKSSSYNGSGNYHVDVSINGGSWNWVSGDIAIGTTSWTYTIPNNDQGTTYRFRVSCGNDVGWSGHTYSGTVTINRLIVGDMSVQNTFNPYTATQSNSNSILPVSFTTGSQDLSGTLYYKAQLYYGKDLVSSTIFSSKANGTTLNISLPSTTYTNTLGVTKYSDTFTIKAWLENQNGTKSNTIQTNFKVDINTDGGATPIVLAPTIAGGALGNPSTCFIAHESTISITCGLVAFRRVPTNVNLTTYYSIKNNDEEISRTNSGSFKCWQSGTFTYSITVSDSRGLSTTIEKQYVVQSYSNPRIVITSSGRKTSPNTSATITYSVYYSPIYQYTSVNTKGNQLNGVSVQQYSKNGGSWTSYTSGTEIKNLDTNYSYDFDIRISDKFKTTTYVKDSCIIPTIKSLLSMRSYGIGLGCIPQVGHTLEVGGNVQFNNALKVNGNTSLNDLVEIRGGTSSANKRLLDFGWSGSSAKHSIVLETTGALRFSAYNGSAATDSLRIGSDGTASTSNLKVSGILNVASIQDYSSNPMKIGLMAVSNAREWIGLYDINAPTTRYFWMGRNKDANKKFYFSGEPSIERFVFNKPITAPSTLSLVSDNNKVVNFSVVDDDRHLVVDKSICSTGYIYIGGTVGNRVTHTYNGDITSFQWGNDSHSYIHTVTNAGAYGISVWPSDHRLKENINEIYTPALDMITKIRHVEFDWKADGSHVSFGYVADELQEVYSDFVFEVGEEKRKHINSNVLIPVVTKAIQEQQREIECCYDNMGDLAKEVLDLKSELEKLKNNKED